MKIRFADQSIRCRVSKAELNILLSGRAVTLDLALPRDHAFRVNVRPSTLGKWQLDGDPTGLWLTIPLAELQTLSESLPSRAGIGQQFALTNGGAVNVSFEVDVKDRSG